MIMRVVEINRFENGDGFAYPYFPDSYGISLRCDGSVVINASCNIKSYCILRQIVKSF